LLAALLNIANHAPTPGPKIAGGRKDATEKCSSANSAKASSAASLARPYDVCGVGTVRSLIPLPCDVKAATELIWMNRRTPDTVAASARLLGNSVFIAR